MNTNIITDHSFLNPGEFLEHWQGHRRVTRRVMEAFPEDKLFHYSIGRMRPFSAMVHEIISMCQAGVNGVATGNWKRVEELDHTGTREADSKAGLLAQWDDLTVLINSLWPQIPSGKFAENVMAFGQYEGIANRIVLYFVDNEIHHRAQATVYLRSLWIGPPAFWDRK
ncbi:DinB family protein [compost metagenome]